MPSTSHCRDTQGVFSQGSRHPHRDVGWTLVIPEAHMLKPWPPAVVLWGVQEAQRWGLAEGTWALGTSP